MNKANHSALFNASQQRALAALGLPVWHAREAEVTTDSLSNDATVVRHYYRVGEYLIVLPHKLPVNRPQWLDDLALLLGADNGAAEVAPRSVHDWNQQRILHLESDTAENLSVQTKRNLWAQLCDN